MKILTKIENLINAKPVVLFMKGSPQFPQCGFSARTVEILSACEADFAHVDVLQEPEIRQKLPQVSQWPTFPQVFIDGELVGGCDIVIDLYRNGELSSMIARAGQSLD